MARPAALLAVTVLFLGGCTSRVLPLSAQAGSSVTLAVGGDASQGDALGYGGAWLAASGIEDDQRGELRFALVPPSGVPRPLRTLFVTRVFPDPASDAALESRIDPAADDALGIGQVLAVLEIPPDTPPGRYRLTASRQRREAGGATTFLAAPRIGTELEVLPAAVGAVVGRPNRPELAVEGAVADLTAQIPRVVPNPKLLLLFSDPRPAAAHLELVYPREKLAIRGVFEEQHTGRRSIVAWRDAPDEGRLSIDFVDPSQSVSALGVAFHLRDPARRGIATANDFRITRTDLYDPGGGITPGSVRLGAIR